MSLSIGLVVRVLFSVTTGLLAGSIGTLACSLLGCWDWYPSNSIDSVISGIAFILHSLKSWIWDSGISMFPDDVESCLEDIVFPSPLDTIIDPFLDRWVRVYKSFNL